MITMCINTCLDHVHDSSLTVALLVPGSVLLDAV